MVYSMHALKNGNKKEIEVTCLWPVATWLPALTPFACNSFLFLSYIIKYHIEIILFVCTTTIVLQWSFL